ncbi:MAG TPA: hypothetical protein VFX70_22700 [Mycobacteriales bacterium]|nr:hypothetical protein [Mycobacteriales bacterium]
MTPAADTSATDSAPWSSGATADEARVREDAIAETCRRLWVGVSGGDPVTKATVRALVDRVLQDAEDAADVAAADAALAEVRAGAATVPAGKVWAELGVEGGGSSR